MWTLWKHKGNRGRRAGGSAAGDNSAGYAAHVGSILRQARQSLGEDLRQSAAHLRIREPYLRAIEDGRYEDLPGRAYAVGFVRAFAEAAVAPPEVTLTAETFLAALKIPLKVVQKRLADTADRRVVEAMYDDSKLSRAVNVLEELMAERGRQFATVSADIEQLPPSSLAITLRVDEGPKVKVGRINFDGNMAFIPTGNSFQIEVSGDDFDTFTVP